MSALTPGRIIALQLRRDLHVARALTQRSGKDGMAPELEECFDALPEGDRYWANATFEREHSCPGLAHCPMADAVSSPRPIKRPRGCLAVATFLAVAAYVATR